MTFKNLFNETNFILILIILITPHQNPGAEPLDNTEQEWGHVTVRRGAHMFWWLYYTTADVSNYTERPLIIWLQGGPGMPSSGYGNFLEVGPLDMNFEKRNNSLVEDFNVLFIDNPVGVGYSYISDNDTAIPKSDEEIAEDLFRFLKIFMNKKVDFQKVPLYLFGESYGGKMVVELAYQISKKRKKDQHKWNLKGIGLGNSYISPVDYTRSYAPLAFHLGLVDKQGFTRIDELAKQIEVLIGKKDFAAAASQQLAMMETLVTEMPGVDVYNMIAKTNITREPSLFKHLDPLTEIMNSKVKNYLSIDKSITWNFLSTEIYEALSEDLLKSVTRRVEYILNNTDIKVIVYSGALDILVNTAGTRYWMEHLKWKSSEEWLAAPQISVTVGNIIEGYVKQFQNLHLYVIFRAGHSVPMDNVIAFREMFKRELLKPERSSSTFNIDTIKEVKWVNLTKKIVLSTKP